MVVHNLREKRYFYLTDADLEIAVSNGLNPQTVKDRVRKYGWDIDRAINQPTVKRSKEGSRWNEWKDKSVVCKNTFISRLKKGWTHEEAAYKPAMSQSEASKQKRKYSEEHYRIARENGISQGVVRYRVSQMKWDIEKAITTPVMSKKECGSLGLTRRWN